MPDPVAGQVVPSTEASAATAAEDLSQSDISPQDKALANLGLEEHAHRIGLQKTVANSALALAVVMLMAAIVFGAALVFAIVTADGEPIHWHASILVAAFVVPPTILIVALIRAVYQSKDDKGKDSDLTPLVQFLKELASAISQVFKKPH